MQGKPLIQYAIELASQCKAFDSVWVNTESEQLGHLAERLGVCFHRRPESLATDEATNREFTYEFLVAHECDYVVMVNPTSPLLRIETLRGFVDYVKASNSDTVLSVVKDRAETFYEGKPLNFSFTEKVNSQLLTPTERVVWALTAWQRKTYITLERNGQNPVFGGAISTFEIPRDESCDLDIPEDWNIAEGSMLARTLRSDAVYWAEQGDAYEP
jgi:CMP-N-acetylneuraminic acid synthetase